MGATNSVPDEPELAALYDRFLLRVWTDNVEEALFGELFRRGWHLERDRIARGYEVNLANITTTEDLRHLYGTLDRIDLSQAAQPYREVVRRIRAEGILLSDRRVIKLLKLIAASALRHKREQANPGDFWVLRHVWNDPEQIPNLQTIVDPYVEAFEGETWSAERALSAVKEDVDFLDSRRADLRTDTDYADFLQQLESLRRELIRHSAATDRAPEEQQAVHRELLERITGMIDDLMKLLANNL